MAKVRAETPDRLHAVLMESADHRLSLGLAISAAHPEAVTRLLHLIETEKPEEPAVPWTPDLRNGGS